MTNKIFIFILCITSIFFGCDLYGGSDDIAVTAVGFGQSGAIMLAGATHQLNVSITPEDTTNKNVSYSSNNASIARVNETGLITTVAEGNAVVSVTTEDGGTGTMAQLISGEGFSETLPVSTFVPPANSVFGGGVTDPNADAALYPPEGETSIGAADTTLYAFWNSFFTFAVANGEVTITGFSDNWDGETDIEIPSSIHGKPVVSIAARSFMRATGLTSVIIPDSVTTLPAEVFFDLDDLATVSIGAGMASMSFDAFYSCNGIQTITIAAGNTYYNAIDNVIFNEDHS